MNTIRLGAGAGYSGDQMELAEKGELDYLVFECLAERTIALAQQAKLRDSAAGYDPLLAERMRAVLRPCMARIRYELPAISALNFVLKNALGGGVTRSLALDAHGKSLSSAILEFEIAES